MTNRKLMIEVTDEEYELFKRGFKLSDIKTEDLIYELISRSDEKTILSKDLLSGTPNIRGCVHIPDGEFRFDLHAIKYLRVSSVPGTLDPLAKEYKGLTNESLNKLYDKVSDGIIDSDSGGRKPW